MARRPYTKSPAVREEIERLTRAYLDNGGTIRHYAPKMRRGETHANAPEREHEKREQERE
jgi:hypothetical protein